MSDCEYLQGCPFFHDRMAAAPGTAEVFKLRYCRGDNTRCARFQVRTQAGREHVPPDLFPNDDERAAKILGEARA